MISLLSFLFLSFLFFLLVPTLFRSEGRGIDVVKKADELQSNICHRKGLDHIVGVLKKEGFEYHIFNEYGIINAKKTYSSNGIISSSIVISADFNKYGKIYNCSAKVIYTGP
jgi:hypothetical protein